MCTVKEQLHDAGCIAVAYWVECHGVVESGRPCWNEKIRY